VPALDLVFETHSTSLDNEAGLASGWFDVDLSPLGERQARELGQRRRDDEFDAVYCSDFRRTSFTAQIAFGGRGIPIVPDSRLRECDYGALTRHPSAEVDSRRVDHISIPFPGGESYEDVARRVEEWLDSVTRIYEGRRIVVIGHRATFYALEHLIDGTPLRDVIAAPWQWQPGWSYTVTRDRRPRT
jgi:broad specificity phosphatase PhoE